MTDQISVQRIQGICFFSQSGEGMGLPHNMIVKLEALHVLEINHKVFFLCKC